MPAARGQRKKTARPGSRPKTRPVKSTGRSTGGRGASRSAQDMRAKPGRPVKRGATKPSKSPAHETTTTRPPRLQKVLASAGIGSRRDCEEYIVAGRVEIDGDVVTELGVRVDPATQEIRLDGDVVRQERVIYYAVNKPPGVLSTTRDPAGRMRVVDLVPPGVRLFTVGRLDKASEGLMLVTNDGELANRLAHPRYQVEKTYLVTVAGQPTPETLNKLRRGVHLAEGVVKVARLRIKKCHKQSAVLEMVLTEGRNREIRRMAARIGHKVISLKRIGIGSLRLADMPPGAYRPVTRDELRRLRSLVGQGSASHRRGVKGRAARQPRKKVASKSAAAPANSRFKAKRHTTPTRPAKRTKKSRR